MLDADEEGAAIGVESTPVISAPFGPTRKRFSRNVPGFCPTKVDWVAVVPPLPVLVMVFGPPSRIVSTVRCSAMQE